MVLKQSRYQEICADILKYSKGISSDEERCDFQEHLHQRNG